MAERKEVEILLVEDNSDDVALALRALRKSKVANVVQVVRDGEEAIDFLFCRGAYSDRSFDFPPTLVLLDLKLPRMDGLTILKTLRNDPRTEAIPVVVMTSSDEQRDIVEGYELGINSYIQKPVDFDQFSNIIREIGYCWLVVEAESANR